MAIFAVSYDSVDVLAQFASGHGIAYPLLSDDGSTTIRALGLYNEHLVAQQAFYGRPAQAHHFGIPYPGLFVLDDRGMVESKVFEQSYRVRPTASTLDEIVLQTLPSEAVSAEVESSDVKVRAWLAMDTYRPYQKLHLHVDLDVAPGMHIYAPPSSDGLVPLSVVVEPFEGLEVGELDLPAPKPLAVEGLDDQYLVYEGAVGATLPFDIIPVLPEVLLTVEVGYQVCSDYACFPPSKVRVELPLHGAELIRE